MTEDENEDESEGEEENDGSSHEFGEDGRIEGRTNDQRRQFSDGIAGADS